MKRSIFDIVLIILGAAALAFIVAPIFSIALSTAPSELLATMREDAVTKSLSLTFLAALAATVAGLLMGVPLAYMLARGRIPGGNILEAAIQIPVIIPHSAAGIALLSVIGSKTALGSFAARFGISFVDSFHGIAVAMAFVSFPFLLNSSINAFRAVNPSLEMMARACGDSPLRSFLRVTLPLAKGGILSGMIMMWARGISEFGAVIVIAYHPMIAPILIYERFTLFGLSHARPVALILIVVCMLIFLLLLKTGRRRND